MKHLFLTLIMMTAFFSTSAPAEARNIHVDNTPVQALDLSRYLGRWYEIARYDHRFERGLDNTVAVYTLKSDGTVRVENAGWKGGKYKVSTGKAKQPRPLQEPALLRVSFFGPFYSDYRVLMLDEFYRFALVGSGNSKYLWILSRTPQIPYQTRLAIVHEAQRRGYDTNQLIWVDQSDNLKVASIF